MKPRLFSSKSIISTKEPLLRSTVFSFSAQTHFQWECTGHFYASIKIAISKTLRRLETTWNFARSTTRVSTHSSTEPPQIHFSLHFNRSKFTKVEFHATPRCRFDSPQVLFWPFVCIECSWREANSDFACVTAFWLALITRCSWFSGQ